MTDKTDIANAFNAYFTNTVKTSMTALNTPSNKTFNHYMNDEHTHLFCFETIDDEIISKTIDSIQPKTSCGFDGISSQLLKIIKTGSNATIEADYKSNTDNGYLSRQT